MTDKLYAHQKEAFERFKDATEIALFMEQGTGKSATILAIVAHKYKRGDIDSLLIIAPNGVHYQWYSEQLPLWLDASVPREVQCFGGRGGAKTTYPFVSKDSLHIMCVNVDTFSTPTKWKEIVDWATATKCMIVLDEASSVKHPKTKRTQRILYEFNDVVKQRKRILSSTVKTVARAILTGTPTTNSLTDMWCLMEFLRPNYFKRDWYSFRNRYAMLVSIVTAYGTTQVVLSQEMWARVRRCNDYYEAYKLFGVTADTFNTIQLQNQYQGAFKHEEELKQLIAPVSMFRTLKDCVDMPPQVFNKKVVLMSPEQERAYKDMEHELLTVYGGTQCSAANKLAAMVRLSQISSGFVVQGKVFERAGKALDETNGDGGGIDERDIEPGEVTWLGDGCPKLEALYRDVEESSFPSIVVTRFSAEASRIYEDLSKTYKVLLYTGWKKTGTIEDFKDGKYDIMVANIRCISRGFNLQNAHQMFFYSNTFSLEDRLQTEGRIFRIGQQHPCVYTDYINEDTIDSKIVAALRQKRSLLDYIRGVSLTAFLQEA